MTIDDSVRLAAMREYVRFAGTIACDPLSLTAADREVVPHLRSGLRAPEIAAETGRPIASILDSLRRLMV